MLARCLFGLSGSGDMVSETTTLWWKVGVICGGGGDGAADEIAMTSTEGIALITLTHSWKALSMKKDGRR